MPAPSLLTSLIRALAFGVALAGTPALASEPKAAPADEAKAGKPAKGASAAPAEDAKPAKPAKAARHGEASAAGSGKAGARPDEQSEAARLEDLGAKIAEKLAKAKASDSGPPGALVIRVKSPERAAGSGHGAPAQHSAPMKSASQPELHALVLAASQREALRTAAAAPAGDRHGEGHASHWSYTGDGGPQNWARLKPEFAKCAEGARQSPINIRGGIKVDLEPISFEYRPSSFSVIDNGHTVQVNVDGGNYIAVMGRRFELVQFHFHRPAEERVDGRVYDMVAHLVHKDPEGRLAVIAVLMDRGQAHPMIQTVWNNLPLERGEEIGGTAQINLGALLPANRSYYTYMGSLTTPPCSEGVLWMVMKEPVQMSTEQIGIFSRLYPMNARPIQSASGRLIKQSN